MIGFREYYNMLEEKQKYTEHRKSPHDKLLKYVDDPDLFVSFTKPVSIRGTKRTNRDSWEKIGINPYNRFRTPTAIYTYPLNKSKRYIISFDFPFAAKGATSAWVLRVKRPERIARSSTYSSADLKKDVETLQEIFHNYNMEELINSKHVKRGSHIQTFWGLTRLIAHLITNQDPSDRIFINERNNPMPHKWAYIMNHFYDGMVDDRGEGFIYISEPLQGCFFSKAYLEVVDHIEEPEGFTADNWKSSPLEDTEGFVRGEDQKGRYFLYSKKDNVKITLEGRNASGSSPLAPLHHEIILSKNGKSHEFGVIYMEDSPVIELYSYGQSPEGFKTMFSFMPTNYKFNNDLIRGVSIVTPSLDDKWEIEKGFIKKVQVTPIRGTDPSTTKLQAEKFIFNSIFSPVFIQLIKDYPNKYYASVTI